VQDLEKVDLVIQDEGGKGKIDRDADAQREAVGLERGALNDTSTRFSIEKRRKGKESRREGDLPLKHRADEFSKFVSIWGARCPQKTTPLEDGEAPEGESSQRTASFLV